MPNGAPIAPTVKAGLAEQCRVIHAMLMREMLTRFGGSRLGFLTIVIEPAVYVIFMIMIRSARGGLAPFGVDMALFVATGIVPFLMFRFTVMKAIRCASVNKSLLFITEVKLFDAYFTRMLLEYLLHMLVFWLFVAALFGLGITSRIEAPLGVIYGITVLSVFSGGAGLCAAALCAAVPQAEAVIAVLMRILLVTSGVIFSVMIVPVEYRHYLEWNPVLHCMEYIRSAFFPVYESQVTGGSLAYVWEITVIFWTFGLIAIRRMRRRLLER